MEGRKLLIKCKKQADRQATGSIPERKLDRGRTRRNGKKNGPDNGELFAHEEEKMGRENREMAEMNGRTVQGNGT